MENRYTPSSSEYTPNAGESRGSIGTPTKKVVDKSASPEINFDKVRQSVSAQPDGQLETRPSTSEKVRQKTKDLFSKASDLGKGAVDKTKAWYNGVKDKYNNQESTYEDPYLQSPDVNYRTSTVPTDEEERNNQNIMKERLAETEDLIQKGAEEGAKANAALQNVKVPRSKLVSFGDILNSEEYKGQRVPYMANAIGTALANSLSGLSGREYDSYLKQQNQQMADTYAQNKAARDTAATNANIQDIEAGNKAEFGKYVQMSDAMTEAALKRYGLLEDTENKRQMLEGIINDATGLEGVRWGDLDADEKIAVMSLMQAYNGDYSMMSLAMEKYGDKIFDFLDRLTNKIGEKLGISSGSNDEEPTDEDISGNITLSDGTTVPKSEYAKNKDKYVEIPMTGQDPVYIKIDTGTPMIGAGKTQSYVDALMKSNLSDKDKIEYAYKIDGWKDSSNPGLRGRVPAPTVSAIKKAMGINDEENDLQNRIVKSYGNLDALKSLEKEVSKTKNPELQAYYNQAVGVATVKKEMSDWKKDSSLTTQDKIDLLDKLGSGQYATYIANDPSLQNYIEQERQGYEIRQKYNDPLLDETNKYFTKSTGNGKGGSWRLQSNGNIAQVQNKGKKTDIQEYDLGSSKATSDFDKATWSKIIENLLVNTPNAVLSTYNQKSNRTLTMAEAKDYFKQSSEYAAIEKLLGNTLLGDLALARKQNGEFEDKALNNNYVLLQKLYERWD